VDHQCISASPEVRISSFSTSTQSRKSVYFTERLRQKIWGTESPPGLKDPYRARSEQNEQVTVRRPVRTESRKQTLAPDLTNYEPATTWDNLEEVGYKVQDSGPPYQGFMGTEVMTDSDEITAAVHRAMVEVVALQLSGKPLSSVSNSFPDHDMTEDVQLVVHENTIDLVYPDDSPFEQVLRMVSGGSAEIPQEVAHTPSSSEDINVDGAPVDNSSSHRGGGHADKLFEDTAAVTSEMDAQDEPGAVETLSSERAYEELIATWDPAWLQISLEDLDFKFAFVKRVMQLTGIRISDAHLNSAKSVEGLLKNLVKPAPPAKLVDALAEKEDLMSLPNVSVYASRRTQKHEETSVGRWKVIERELEERGLPVPWSSERPPRPVRPRH